MAIDHAVSRAIFLAHTLEKAVHDNGPWTLSLNGIHEVATREISDDGVRFSAVFPIYSRTEGELTLYCGGEFVIAKHIILPDCEQAQVDYELTLPTEVRA